MTEEPKTLRLADALMTLFPSREDGERAAAELRRLHAENFALAAQRDALLEALKLARSVIGHPDDAHTQMIDAAIKSVKK